MYVQCQSPSSFCEDHFRTSHTQTFSSVFSVRPSGQCRKQRGVRTVLTFKNIVKVVYRGQNATTHYLSNPTSVGVHYSIFDSLCLGVFRGPRHQRALAVNLHEASHTAIIQHQND